MIARTCADIAVGGVLRRVEGRPPLTLRRITSEDPDVCALCLVGSAAGPLAGDDLTMHLELHPGARATLQAAGAHLAQGRPGQPKSRLRCSATLAAGAQLRVDPGPLVVCAGATVELEVALEVGDGAGVDWTELVVLGRQGEPAAGNVGLRWDVLRSGSGAVSGTDSARAAPLLRQRLDLADPALAGWGGLLRGRRVLASRLLVGPGVHAHTVVGSPSAVAQQLAEDAVLVTVLADDAAAAIRSAAALAAQCRCVAQRAALVHSPPAMR